MGSPPSSDRPRGFHKNGGLTSRDEERGRRASKEEAIVPSHRYELTVPNHPTSVAVVSAAVVEIGRRVGLSEDDLQAVRLSVGEACVNVIEHAYTEGQEATFRVTCEVGRDGLTIRIRDWGMPFDPRALNPDGPPDKALGLRLMQSFMDQVHFINRGRNGKEVMLVKHFSNPALSTYYNVLRQGVTAEVDPTTYEIRLMRPDEGPGVSRCLYRTYGYSYAGEENLYYPEWIARMNAQGEVISAVAVVPDGEIVGHAALLRCAPSPGIYELAQGAVVPEHRGRNLLYRIIEFLMGEARRRGLRSVFTEPVTNHLWSQRPLEDFGFTDCALMLGIVPHEGGRLTLLWSMSRLGEGPSRRIHPPPRHESLIRGTCKAAGLARSFSSARHASSDQGRINVTMQKLMNAARIEVPRIGTDTQRDLARLLVNLKLQRVDVIHLDIELEDPGAPDLCEFAEELGFFYCGLLPDFGQHGDLLRLQFLNNLTVDFDAIQCHSELAKALHTYVRAELERSMAVPSGGGLSPLE